MNPLSDTNNCSMVLPRLDFALDVTRVATRLVYGGYEREVTEKLGDMLQPEARNFWVTLEIVQDREDSDGQNRGVAEAVCPPVVELLVVLHKN